MGEEDLSSDQLRLSEGGDGVVAPRGEGDHATVGRRDREGDVAGWGVAVKGSELFWSEMPIISLNTEA